MKKIPFSDRIKGNISSILATRLRRHAAKVGETQDHIIRKALDKWLNEPEQIKALAAARRPALVKFEIEIPAAHIDRIRSLLAKLEIPESEISRAFTESLASACWDSDSDLWTCNHVYPNRAAAIRIAKRLGGSLVCLHYRKAGKVVRESFVAASHVREIKNSLTFSRDPHKLTGIAA